MKNRINIGVLISGGGSNMQAIIDACANGKIAGDIVFVGSDNPNAGGLAKAEKHGIPTFVVDYASIIRQLKKDPANVLFPEDMDMEQTLSKLAPFSDELDRKKMAAFVRSRTVAEARVIKNMASYSYDLLVLAGFMRTLTPYFIDKVNPDSDNLRIMNIHPALLPAFPGVDGYGDTFRYGCKIAGCTVHFVDYGEDTGPIIGQRTFAIRETDTIETIREKGLKLEWELYPECIQFYAQNRLRTLDKTYILKNGATFKRRIVRVLPSRDNLS
jgi:phosphoribosylglycinamide formyltransferase-1